MTFSLYDATVPNFLQQLGALDGIVAKAQQACNEGGATEAAIQEARLADDMLPFPYQVRWGPLHSIKAIEACRAGSFSPDMTPPPATFADQRAMLADAMASLKALDRAEIDGLLGKDIVFSVPSAGIELPFTAENFLLSFSLPNFYFHVTTAYALLRAAGIPIGKRDYLGAMRIKGMA
jgi:hypothetical protein